MLLQHVWVSVRWDAFIVKMLFSPSVSWFLSIDPVSLHTKLTILSLGLCFIVPHVYHLFSVLYYGDDLANPAWSLTLTFYDIFMNYYDI